MRQQSIFPYDTDIKYTGASVTTEHIDKEGEEVAAIGEGRGTCIQCVRSPGMCPGSTENFDTRTREQQLERSRYHHENERVRPTGATAPS